MATKYSSRWALLGWLLLTSACAAGSPRQRSGSRVEGVVCEKTTRQDLLRRQQLPRRNAGPGDVPPPREEMIALMRAVSYRGDRRVNAVIVVLVCVSPAGELVSARVRQPSGLPGWDQRVLDGIAASSFCPFEADSPAPFCVETTTTFRMVTRESIHVVD